MVSVAAPAARRRAHAPAVSAIVCTRDRPHTLRRALASVLAQTLAPAELIVVDDGSDPPVRLPESPLRQRLVRLEGEGPGAARAAGLAAARGELVAWCDDDDEWFPDHLGTLVSALAEDPDAALVYGDAEWWQGDERGAVAYSIDYDGRLLREDNYIFASSAVCRADALRAAGGFDGSLAAFEDWDVWLRLSVDHRIRHVRRTLGAMRWSGDGVAAGDRWTDWERVWGGHRARVRRLGAAAEHDLVPRRRMPPFDPTTWCDDRRELVWHSILGESHSFGVVSRHLIAAFERHGVEVRIAPTRNQPLADLRRHYRPDDGRGRIGFYYDTHRRPSVLACPRVVNYSMWESTALPDGEVEEINRAVALQCVPSRRNRDTYVAAGVEPPVAILPHGIDARRFPLLDRPPRDAFTFGTFSDFSPRKGIDVLVAAFLEEFAPDEPVRLVLKATRPGHRFGADDPRIEWRSGLLGAADLLELLREMDVFAMPSRGEGWGLPGLEAMATGLPLIATAWDGPAEYLDAADSLPLDYRLVDCDGVYSNYTVYHGQWAEPDRDHLRRLMRWSVENRDRLPDMGRRAAARVRRDFTWDRAALILRDELDRLSAGWSA